MPIEYTINIILVVYNNVVYLFCYFLSSLKQDLHINGKKYFKFGLMLIQKLLDTSKLRHIKPRYLHFVALAEAFSCY
jgi:hypothetical protein